MSSKHSRKQSTVSISPDELKIVAQSSCIRGPALGTVSKESCISAKICCADENTPYTDVALSHFDQTTDEICATQFADFEVSSQIRSLKILFKAKSCLGSRPHQKSSNLFHANALNIHICTLGSVIPGVRTEPESLVPPLWATNVLTVPGDEDCQCNVGSGIPA